MPSLTEVPAKEVKHSKNGLSKADLTSLIFGAVDFDWSPGQPFNHHWQDYRTRKDRSLKTVSDAGFSYKTLSSTQPALRSSMFRLRYQHHRGG